MWDAKRQRYWTRRRRQEPWEEISFLFNSLLTLESVYPEKGLNDWESMSIFDVSGALLTALENPREIMSSHLVVLITAAGLQGEQPLVDRTM
jgi:hypothetical protein